MDRERGERGRPGLEVRPPGVHGSAALVGREVLDDDAAHQVRVPGGEGQRVQAAHGVSDRDDRSELALADHVDQVGDELLGAGGSPVRVAAVRAGVDTDDSPVAGEPSGRAPPGGRAAHQTVQQQDAGPFPTEFDDHPDI